MEKKKKSKNESNALVDKEIQVIEKLSQKRKKNAKTIERLQE